MQDDELRTVNNIKVQSELQPLYDYLAGRGSFVHLDNYKPDFLPIFSRDVLRRIAAGNDTWETMVQLKWPTSSSAAGSSATLGRARGRSPAAGGTVDITQLILDDHHEQRRLFAILEQIDPGDTGTLGDLWARLSAFLEVHAAGEEEVFYPELLRVGQRTGRVGTTEEETLDAIHDHNDIRDTIAAVADQAVGTAGWRDAVAAVNRANGDHMAEEEREGLTDFRRFVGLQERHDLAVAFADFEARHFAGVQPVDRDPATYVREAERSAGRRPSSGSLDIGSLKGF